MRGPFGTLMVRGSAQRMHKKCTEIAVSSPVSLDGNFVNLASVYHGSDSATPGFSVIAERNGSAPVIAGFSLV